MRATEKPPQSAYYWLATRFDGVRMEILTVEAAGESVLPVFGSRDRARAFLLSERGRERWRARPIGTGELVSMIASARPEIGRVVFDPPPEELEDRSAEPFGQSRGDFIGSLLDGDPWPDEGPGSRAAQRTMSGT